MYALEHAKGIYENWKKSGKAGEPLNLTRSGWAGIQKYGAVLWSGDVSARWDVLERQIPDALNLAMCGVPWWTCDTGGFFVVQKNWQARGCGMNTNPQMLWFWHGEFEYGLADDEYKLLYVRWLEFSCFIPMMRSHGTDVPREIWNFGEEGTPYYDAIAKYIRLRYKFLPYILRIAKDSVEHNTVMMRGLLFDFPDDDTAANLGSEYMFGSALLVCPVTKPLREMNGIWKCYLPEGAEWDDFWTGEHYTGGQWVEKAAPLDIIPLFVRSGFTLSLCDRPIQSTEEL
jgi:alpha-D-xyloside xylohydrolase